MEKLTLLLEQHPLWQQAKDWYERLASKDRNALLALTVFITVTLFYLLAWEPLDDWSGRQQEDYSQQLETMNWMQQHLDKARELEKKKKSGAGQKELSSIVTTQARQTGVIISRIQPDQKGVAVWVEDAAYQKLLAWLVILKNRHFVNVQQIKIDRLKEEGRVKGYVHLGTR
ncbi:type II secretion system protein M [Endozoicomonas sp. Mp262]|uniref:type II secretion system protein M n=1 Tax=Endozoicomonas sp. Mp262 TaxID=2919499 RepID=UPI0021DAFB56